MILDIKRDCYIVKDDDPNEAGEIYFFPPTEQELEETKTAFLAVIYMNVSDELKNMVLETMTDEERKAIDGKPMPDAISRRSAGLCNFFDRHYSHSVNIKIPVKGKNELVGQGIIEKINQPHIKAEFDIFPPSLKIQAMTSMYFRDASRSGGELDYFLLLLGLSYTDWQKEMIVRCSKKTSENSKNTDSPTSGEPVKVQ